jgi:hypothetical protein
MILATLASLLVLTAHARTTQQVLFVVVSLAIGGTWRAIRVMRARLLLPAMARLDTRVMVLPQRKLS